MNSSVYWPDESLPVTIFCAPGILTDLERQATDGLLAIPRTGLGIGGLLLGRQEGGRLEIVKTVEIACSHAMGPSFVLTPEEVAEAKALKEVDSELVGWYCSKPNGRMALSDHDKLLFEALCGERGRVALLIQPKLGQATMATFAIKGEGPGQDGFRLGLQNELLAPEKRSVPEPEVEAVDGLPHVTILPEPAVAAPVMAEPPPKQPVEPVVPVIADERPKAPEKAPYMPPGGTLFRAEVKQERHLLRRVAFTIIILVALAVIGFLGRYLVLSGISK